MKMGKGGGKGAPLKGSPFKDKVMTGGGMKKGKGC